MYLRTALIVGKYISMSHETHYSDYSAHWSSISALTLFDMLSLKRTKRYWAKVHEVLFHKDAAFRLWSYPEDHLYMRGLADRIWKSGISRLAYLYSVQYTLHGIKETEWWMNIVTARALACHPTTRDPYRVFLNFCCRSCYSSSSCVLSMHLMIAWPIACLSACIVIF